MYISVRVEAGARKESIQEFAGGRLAISVKEPAERNLANRRTRELVAEYFSIPLGKVRLVSGHTSPSKIFDVDRSEDQ